MIGNLIWVLFAASALVACGPRSQSLAGRLEAQQLSATSFGAGSLEIDDGALVAQRNGPGGMGVMITPGPRAGAERFVIHYEASADVPLNLRTKDGDRLHYGLASAGEVLVGGTVSEVLIYSDDAQRIDVRINEVAACGASHEGMCFAREDLHAAIFPNGEPADPRERLLTLLDWASRHADYALSDEVDQLGRTYTSQLTPAQMYATMYRTDQAGGYCGSHSVLRKTAAGIRIRRDDGQFRPAAKRPYACDRAGP
jgi:hypothetical protein